MNTQHLIKSILIITTATITFSGCIKRYYPDVYKLPEKSLEIAQEQISQDAPFIPGSWPNKDWWLMFDDQQLNEIMWKAISDNPDIQIALARIRLANFAAKAAGSPLWPSIGFESDITRFRISKTGAIAQVAQVTNTTTPVNPAPTVAGLPGFTFTQYEINVNGTYQLDFWHKNLNTFRAAVNELLATEADAAFSTVAISIGVVQTYFNLQIAYAREKIAKQRIENRKKYVALSEKRLKNQIDNLLSYKTAQSYVAGAEEALKEIQFDIDVYKHQLYALIAGDFLHPFEIIPIEEKKLTPFPIPTFLPLELIAHRPDVTATAWRVEEEARNIQVARAAFYPNFNIAALFGVQTIHPNVLFRWRSIYGQAGPAVTLPIFEGGLLQANLGTSYEQYYIAVEEYNKSILRAVQEVLDGLSGLKYAYGELQDYNQITQLSADNFDLTQNRFKHQIDSYLNVLDAELDTISKTDQKLLSLGNYYIRLTNLIQALGGGYDTGCQPDNCE